MQASARTRARHGAGMCRVYQAVFVLLLLLGKHRIGLLFAAINTSPSRQQSDDAIMRAPSPHRATGLSSYQEHASAGRQHRRLSLAAARCAARPDAGIDRAPLRADVAEPLTPNPSTPNPEPAGRRCQPPEPYTQTPEPYTPNLKPQTLNLRADVAEAGSQEGARPASPHDAVGCLVVARHRRRPPAPQTHMSITTMSMLIRMPPASHTHIPHTNIHIQTGAHLPHIHT